MESGNSSGQDKGSHQVGMRANMETRYHLLVGVRANMETSIQLLSHCA